MCDHGSSLYEVKMDKLCGYLMTFFRKVKVARFLGRYCTEELKHLMSCLGTASYTCIHAADTWTLGVAGVKQLTAFHIKCQH